MKRHKDETRVLGGGAGSEGQTSTSVDVWDCATDADDAHLFDEGAAYAEAYLQRLRAGIADPDELAVIISFLGDELLHGACRVLERALGGRA